jgi:spermidine synthase
MSAIQISEERGVRYLHFGSRWVQGAMRVAKPYTLELEYTRDLMLPLVLRADAEWPRRVLLVGLGAGSLAKFLYVARPHSRITVVEIREDVVAAAGQFFRLPDDRERIGIEIGDAAHYLAADGPRFDFIVVDGYDARGRVGALDTPAFYRRCRARLRGDGFLATNLIKRHHGVDASVGRMAHAFGERVVALPACASGNIAVLAALGASADLEPAALEERIRTLRAQAGLSLTSAAARLLRVRTGTL